MFALYGLLSNLLGFENLHAVENFCITATSCETWHVLTVSSIALFACSLLLFCTMLLFPRVSLRLGMILPLVLVRCFGLRFMLRFVLLLLILCLLLRISLYSAMLRFVSPSPCFGFGSDFRIVY